MYNQKLRPRRMRITPAMRAMVRETTLSAKDFVYPIFVVPGEHVKEEIPSMPNCYHLSVDNAAELAKEIAALGIPAVEAPDGGACGGTSTMPSVCRDHPRHRQDQAENPCRHAEPTGSESSITRTPITRGS